MKNVLILSTVLLSVCAFADGRTILASFEQRTIESDEDSYGTTIDITLRGFGGKFYEFRDQGLYLAANFTHLTGEIDVSGIATHGSVTRDAQEAIIGGEIHVSDTDSRSVTGDASETIFGGEIGRIFDRWIPFVGTSFHRAEIEIDIPDGSESDDDWSFNAGTWYELSSNVLLRGVVNGFDDSENRSIEGEIFYQTERGFVVGLGFETLLKDEADGFGFSLQFGRVF